MATTVVTAVETIAPLESVHIDPPDAHLANHAAAEPGIPLETMEGLRERQRTTQGRLLTSEPEIDESSQGSVQPSTPSSTEELEQEQGNEKPIATSALCPSHEYLLRCCSR